MPYDRLRDRLSEPLDGSVVCLPDGSVDTLATVRDGSGNRIETREAFGERIAAGRLRSVELAEADREPGGQAVNAARQAHALGADATLFGHLDDPLLSFPFETYSMGTPAQVTVCRFGPEDLMLSRPTADIADWTAADLLELDAPVRERVETADAVCTANWASFPDLPTVLREFATWAVGAPVVLDPGDLGGGDGEATGELCGALAALDDSCPVVLSANDSELSTLADSLGVVPREPPTRERALRAALDVSGVVLHEKPRAVAATGDQLDGPATVEVGNFEIEAVRRRTGASDRFSGALAYALGAGLGIETGLALGNACASAFVAGGETVDRESLSGFLADRTPR